MLCSAQLWSTSPARCHARVASSRSPRRAAGDQQICPCRSRSGSEVMMSGTSSPGTGTGRHQEPSWLASATALCAPRSSSGSASPVPRFKAGIISPLEHQELALQAAPPSTQHKGLSYWAQLLPCGLQAHRLHSPYLFPTQCPCFAPGPFWAAVCLALPCLRRAAGVKGVLSAVGSNTRSCPFWS